MQNITIPYALYEQLHRPQKNKISCTNEPNCQKDTKAGKLLNPRWQQSLFRVGHGENCDLRDESQPVSLLSVLTK